MQSTGAQAELLLFHSNVVICKSDNHSSNLSAWEFSRRWGCLGKGTVCAVTQQTKCISMAVYLPEKCLRMLMTFSWFNCMQCTFWSVCKTRLLFTFTHASVYKRMQWQPRWSGVVFGRHWYFYLPRKQKRSSS